MDGPETERAREGAKGRELEREREKSMQVWPNVRIESATGWTVIKTDKESGGRWE